MTSPDVRATVARQLRQSEAHTGLRRALDGLPAELAGRSVDGYTHTAWEQVEHLRLAAEDLVRYCVDPDYQELGWPDGYWPDTAAPPSADAWSDSCRRLLEANEAMARRVEDTDVDLAAPAPSSDKAHHHTLRAALILLDHNGYHAAQLVGLRQALGIWPPG